MSPIEGISDIRHYPRLGKIRLGEKAEGQRGLYPKALDHFKVPEEVAAIHGDKPKELPIMFPNDDLDLIAPQWLKCYSYSQGLICRGNGRTCRRKVGVDTGDFADKSTMAWEMADGICDPDHCPKIGDKQCRRIMNLLFILPDVPGLGVYQLDTSSFYSIVNLNSQLAPDGFLRHFTNGRIAFIPLILSVEPQEVTPPGMGRKTVHILNVRADIKLADIIRISRQRPAQVLLPTVQEDEPPEDLYPDEIIGGTAADPAPQDTPQSAPQDAEQPAKSARELADRHYAEQVEHDTPEANACHCNKPVPAEEVIQNPGGSCYHRSCGGYLCTPPIDCYPGCPHMPLETGAETGTTAKASKGLKLGKGELGKAALSSPATAGEGAHIDLEWLNETLKHIHWPEDTAKSWLSSHFVVDTQGELTDVLQRLTREQADQFTRELNDRASK